jgi:hypothetical protein
MAADDEQLSVVPLDRLTEHVPGITFHHLEHSVAHLHLWQSPHSSTQLGRERVSRLRKIYLRAELLGLVDDALGDALQVSLHERYHIRRA